MRFPHVCLALAALLLSASASAQVLAGPIVNPANGHAYYLLEQDSWTNSESEAIALGGHLATVDDAAEDAWIYATFATFGGVDRHLWIGLNDAASEGSFVWSSGDPVGYTNFSPGQPDDSFGEDYVHISVDDFSGFLVPTRWNDLPDSAAAKTATPAHGVVEVPTSATVAASSAFGRAVLGASLLVGALARRRRLDGTPGRRRAG